MQIKPTAQKLINIQIKQVFLWKKRKVSPENYKIKPLQ